MELINYEKLIKIGFCSRKFIDLLSENEKDNDIQISLSIISRTYTVDEVSLLTHISVEEIMKICKGFYQKYFCENTETENNDLGWLDSGKHRDNPKMGSYKGY